MATWMNRKGLPSVEMFSIWEPSKFCCFNDRNSMVFSVFKTLLHLKVLSWSRDSALEKLSIIPSTPRIEHDYLCRQGKKVTEIKILQASNSHSSDIPSSTCCSNLKSTFCIEDLHGLLREIKIKWRSSCCNP